MSIVAFDTLKFVEKLEAAGIERPHAKATAEAVAESIAVADLATKSDLAAVKAELKNDIAAVKAELKADLAAVEHRLEKKVDSVIAEAAATKAELKADIAALEQRMTTGFRDIEQRMTIKLGGMMMAIAVLIVAAIKYLPPGH